MPMHKEKRRASVFAATSLLLLLPFGCGGDEDAASSGEPATPAPVAPTELTDGACVGPNACQLESEDGEFHALVPAGASVTLDGQALTMAPNPDVATHPGLVQMGAAPYPESVLAEANLDGLAFARESARSNVTLPVRIDFADGTHVEGTHALRNLDLTQTLQRLSIGVLNGTPLDDGTRGAGLVFVSSATSAETEGRTVWSGNALPAAGLNRWSEVGFIGVTTDVLRREVGTCNYRLADGTPEPATKFQLYVSARLVRADGTEIAQREFAGPRPSCPRQMAAGAVTVDGDSPDEGGVLRWLRAQAAEAE